MLISVVAVLAMVVASALPAMAQGLEQADPDPCLLGDDSSCPITPPVALTQDRGRVGGHGRRASGTLLLLQQEGPHPHKERLPQ